VEFSKNTITVKRVEPPSNIASSVLVKAHYRCAICPEHRRVADLHHIDPCVPMILATTSGYEV